MAREAPARGAHGDYQGALRGLQDRHTKPHAVAPHVRRRRHFLVGGGAPEPHAGRRAQGTPARRAGERTRKNRLRLQFPRMLIQSLLDTDLYKFTMMQVVLHHFPGAQVEYRFKCRTDGVDLRPDLPAIEQELTRLCGLRFREDELAYLRSLRFMKSDFVDFLALFQFNEKYVRTGHGEGPGEIDITLRGPWLHTILYEIPVLAIVSEVYFRRTQPHPNLEEGRRRLRAKIDLVRTVEPELEFKISDFGTRRRFSAAWQEEVIQTFKREAPQYFAGTSNVWFAMRNDLTPLGTMAHEYMQACQALGPRLRDSQTFAFDKWAQEYRGDLGIAVADTYGTDAFLRDFDMY